MMNAGSEPDNLVHDGMPLPECLERLKRIDAALFGDGNLEQALLWRMKAVEDTVGCIDRKLARLQRTSWTVLGAVLLVIANGLARFLVHMYTAGLGG